MKNELAVLKKQLADYYIARAKRMAKKSAMGIPNNRIGSEENPPITGQMVGQILGSIADRIVSDRAKSRIPTLGKARKIK